MLHGDRQEGMVPAQSSGGNPSGRPVSVSRPEISGSYSQEQKTDKQKSRRGRLPDGKPTRNFRKRPVSKAFRLHWPARKQPVTHNIASRQGNASRC